MESHDSAWFLTLTYADERIPENGSLRPKDLQGFFKSLRRDYPKGQIRYYACGEYGEQTQRPHYHAVLFGADFLDKCPVPRASSSPVWRSPTLESHWTFGISEFGAVTPESAAYVAGYVRKKVSRKANPEAYVRLNPLTGELVDIIPEFSRMSLRPAVGRAWIEKYWRDVYPRDFVVVGGKEFKPPRYYDKAMEDPQSKCGNAAFERSWNERQHALLEVRERRIEEAEELTRYTLESREINHKARVGLYENRGKI